MRNLRWLESLAKTGPGLPPQDAARIEQNLLLFCEHTFNHSASGKTPWDLNVKAIGGNNRAYACAAFDAAMDARDAMFADRGEMPNMAADAAGMRFVYKVLNPLDTDVTDLAQLYFDNKDYETLEIGPSVVDLSTGKTLEYQKIPAPRGITYCVPVTVKAGGQAVLELVEGTNTLNFSSRSGGICSTQNFDDVEGAEATAHGNPGCIETEHLKLEITKEGGIVSLCDKATGASLLSGNRDHAPFVPVYEIMPAAGKDMASIRATRGGIGRNRKSKSVQRSAGTLRSFRIEAPGCAWIPVTMDYEVNGVTLYQVNLRVWRSLPRIDASVIIHKASVWEAENLYLALPFAVPGGELWIDKAGAPLRPWQDQLPETLTDWYTIQHGFCSCANGTGISIAMPDSPLLQLGPLEYGTRKIMGHPALDIHAARPYAWLMTNYWGTNFDATLGGFYEFNFRIEFGKHLATPSRALHQCALLNHGLKTFQTKAADV